MWFDDFVMKCRDVIMDSWLNALHQEIPGDFIYERAKRNVVSYWQLTVELDVPFGEHPGKETLNTICKKCSEEDKPISSLVKAVQVWKNIFFHYYYIYTQGSASIDQTEVAAICWKVIDRLDNVQQFICSVYWECGKARIEEKERRIHQLHQDRLTLLGKMAASLAHELRNPLFAIEGFVKLIRNELPSKTAPRLESYFHVIDHEFEGVYSQITSLLSFSKNNAVDEPRTSVPLEELITSALTVLNSRLKSESVLLSLNLEIQPILSVRKNEMKQVLINLITNSIDALGNVEHTRKIKIRSYEDDLFCYISIADNGPGIPPHLQSQIFEPFVSGQEHGTGLGLSISKQILEKNYAELSFISEEGETEFTISLPKEKYLVR